MLLYFVIPKTRRLIAIHLIYRDPDCVVLCVLATDEEDQDDIALQIHFTLLQAFCCDNDINILRVSGLRRLAQVLDEPATVDNNEPRDFHCIIVTVSRRIISSLRDHMQHAFRVES